MNRRDESLARTRGGYEDRVAGEIVDDRAICQDARVSDDRHLGANRFTGRIDARLHMTVWRDSIHLVRCDVAGDVVITNVNFAATAGNFREADVRAELGVVFQTGNRYRRIAASYRVGRSRARDELL